MSERQADPADDRDDDWAPVQSPRLWRDDLWTACVIKNEDDEGWAVSMTRRGESEPVLVAPWTMGRDKKNPKPLDINAFNTWIKTAHEVLRRHEQQLHAQLHQQLRVDTPAGRVEVRLDIEPDDDMPSATLSAHDASGELLGRKKVAPDFRLSLRSAQAWLETLDA
ncbi:hypothetical protein [Leptothrix discophora]|uniref:Uncharacterized protein n=1 Tax=Leptothrix discophora TaxID=89 RepID=A0ABT9FZH4_LEPDI|nr:hypothetical protein [Leptothrix discophora]MDP4299447.1 hypothetical protein [Leptothrix discophora]